jgi:hypothetical protein
MPGQLEEIFMARPIYPHELSDPDFQWLLNSYRENRPGVAIVDCSCLPLVMVKLEGDAPEELDGDDLPAAPTVPPVSEESPIQGHGKKEL